MRTLRLTLLIAFCTAGLSAYACEPLPDAQQREADLRDMELQRKLVREFAAQADSIVVAKATSAPPDADWGMFEVDRRIKGHSPNVLRLTWKSLITVGCYWSTWFDNPRIESGGVYLLYIQSGRVLRAGSFGRGPGEITYKEELRLIHELGPNNSFKPKPLRGSA